MQVGGKQCTSWLGFSTEGLDVCRFGSTYMNTAWVNLADGTSHIYSGISLDGSGHSRASAWTDQQLPNTSLCRSIPKTMPFELALRVAPEDNVPQIQFNNDGVWHDFVAEGRAALKAGPCFPYMMLWRANHLSDHRVQSTPRPLCHLPPLPGPCSNE